MRRYGLALAVIGMVVAYTVAAPTRAGAQSVIGLTCWSYDWRTTLESYGVAFWTLSYCVDFLSTRTGVPPITSGDKGFCDERVVVGDPSARSLDCDWEYSPTVADARRSFRDLYCVIIDREYGFQNRQNIGYLYVGCTDRRAYLRAAFG